MQTDDFILSEAVAEVVQDLSGFLAENHSDIRTELPEDVHLHCDKFRFEQILTNLITNAAKYGGEGTIELLGHVERKKVIIEGQDHGRGIDKKDQERIFQGFERVSSPGERNGLGLGLYIVRQLTRMLGGRIRLKSKLGEGSNFILQLPLQA